MMDARTAVRKTKEETNLPADEDTYDMCQDNRYFGPNENEANSCRPSE